MRSAGRVSLLAGGGGLALSALLPWVTIKGLALHLDLGLVGADATPAARTVSGTDTSIWPVLAGIAAIVVLLALLNVARRLILALGLLVVVAGGALVYYVWNVVDIEASGRGAVEQALTHAVLTSSAGPGPPLVLASGFAIVAGALLR